MNFVKTYEFMKFQLSQSRYVFEIYQLEPNASINNGLVLPETSTLTISCAAWGEWRPKQIPRCIRKYTISLRRTIIFFMYLWKQCYLNNTRNYSLFMIVFSG